MLRDLLSSESGQTQGRRGTHSDDIQNAEETVDAVSSQNLLDRHLSAILRLGSRGESPVVGGQAGQAGHANNPPPLVVWGRGCTLSTCGTRQKDEGD